MSTPSPEDISRWAERDAAAIAQRALSADRNTKAVPLYDFERVDEYFGSIEQSDRVFRSDFDWISKESRIAWDSGATERELYCTKLEYHLTHLGVSLRWITGADVTEIYAVDERRFRFVPAQEREPPHSDDIGGQMANALSESIHPMSKVHDLIKPRRLRFLRRGAITRPSEAELCIRPDRVNAAARRDAHRAIDKARDAAKQPCVVIALPAHKRNTTTVVADGDAVWAFVSRSALAISKESRQALRRYIAVFVAECRKSDVGIVFSVVGSDTQHFSVNLYVIDLARFEQTADDDIEGHWLNEYDWAPYDHEVQRLFVPRLAKSGIVT